MAFFSGKLRTDAASHIISNNIVFELFLFLYLVTAFWMQNINIYKTNLHLVDYNLMLFVILLLSRRLVWCLFQQIQTRVQYLGWNLRYWFVAGTVVALVGWVLQQLLQKTSLFNLLFLFYPMLLYFSLFGFTLDPRQQYRERFSTSKQFLGHLNISAGHHGGGNSVCSEGGIPSPINQLLLPVEPEKIRTEVSVIISDLIIRLKQLLFNSLTCAYYVGFIPIQFTPNYVYFDKRWSIEVTFFVWANSFVILLCHLLTPNYCHILHQCALHLGCWNRCSPVDNPDKWDKNKKWMYDSVVELNGEYFKGEGLQNVAVPCDSSQECFYLLFNSRLIIHTWLLALQSVIVAFEIVVLLRTTYWYQILSISIFLLFNYFILHKLLYNRLLFGKLAKVSLPT